ncbi:MAG TPA: hypothetical protein VHQ22_13270 [Terriglobales bacterium]|jgi:hypothetical protein|nr:hypothetical protein [Terriglobales bacterium]
MHLDHNNTHFRFLDSERLGFISLVRKHTRLLNFIGMAVVLLTFAFKEVISDELKDSIDRISRAEDLHETFQTWLGIAIPLQKVSDELVQFHKEYGFQENGATRSKVLNEEYDTTASDVQKAADYFPIVRGKLIWSGYLLDSCYKSPPAKSQRYSDLEKRIQSFEGEMEKYMKAVPPPRGGQLKMSSNFSKISNTIEKDVDSFVVDARTEVNAIKKRKEHWYAYTTILSYLLFTVGWFLAAFDKVILGGSLEIG